MLNFASDYLEGAHPSIIKRLAATNYEQTPGYGTDDHCEHARELIRTACGAPEAGVHFLSGGTQVNAIVLTALLAPYTGVIAAETGHIATHEAGAIEAGGHKVLTVPSHEGKLTADDVAALADGFWEDENHEHMVMPGAVYISQPTEYGTLYTLSDLEALCEVCNDFGMSLYVDGARLAYALASPQNDVTLADLARLTDAFYLGGTKCGALFGEAVVFPVASICPHFFTFIKQRGALLAKGRVLGLQFEELMDNGLYVQGGAHALAEAERIKDALASKGYDLYMDSPTNQIFVALTAEQLQGLQDKVAMGFWEKLADGRTVMRLATSWATRSADVDALIALL